MIADVKKVLIGAEVLDKKIKELGATISKDYINKDLVLIGIMRGAVPFVADLMRAITIPLEYDLMAVSSYGASTKSSGTVRIMKDIDMSIEDRDVIIVEDIVDTGLTLQYLVDNLKARKPKSLKVCTLLDKPSRRKVEVVPDYNGFIIPDVFVVGYGLDYAEKYRNLPYIGVLKEEIYMKSGIIE
ncbi:MAG TPA: hypoxanthine phosphoribosyltransferase [Bacillota bacterium]|nr:hypoxanthine phosphoribosyltransferase [Bacillota bacterium]HOL08676.1 hypoxanthine phosphoribosyltransferase [Bacillota bacterium]HPO96622.1 hypoxanthine phosphoribosyltransferase [Bacillota bacterium]